MAELEVVVYDRGDTQCSLRFSGPVEVGRQRRVSENLFAPFVADEGRSRLVIARTTEDNISKQHALIETIDRDRVRVTNLSNVQPVYFENPFGPPLMPGEKREVGLPQLVRLGTARALRLQTPGEGGEPTPCLPGATIPPGSARSPRIPELKGPEGLVRHDEMIEWFAGVINFLQADPANTDEFYNRVSRCLVEMVGLDTGRVLFLEGGQWQQRTVHVAPQQLGQPFRPASQTLLQKVVANKRTFWEAPAGQSGPSASVLGLDSVVAAPLLDRKGGVIGALYGERGSRGLAGRAGVGGPVTKLEAMLVELLAHGVAAGLARVDEERKAGQAIALFEQFFGPKLARHLAQTPGWERPKQSNITLLFCDIRGFTRISKKLSPQETYEWVRDVLDMLSSCVLDNDGVLVDYVGDEVLSMWGAPQEQDDHAVRACQAAMDMLERLPELNERWAATLGKHGESTDLTIGLNSGTAQVGNVGSRWKFKYGAQGPTVNTGSRVMNSNKYFQSRVLMTRQTWEQPGVKDAFFARRLGAVRLNNVADPVEMFELKQEGSADWPGWRDEYERALALFEKEEFRPAGRMLATWREHHPEDQPALVLLARAVNAMVGGVPPEHPVWVLTAK